MKMKCNDVNFLAKSMDTDETGKPVDTGIVTFVYPDTSQEVLICHHVWPEASLWSKFSLLMGTIRFFHLLYGAVDF